VIGGILSQFLGWRSVFFFLLILAVLFLIPFLAFFPETARNVVGDGSIPPQGWNMSYLNYRAARKVRAENSANFPLSRTVSRDSQRAAQVALARKRRLRWPNPLKTLRVIGEKDIGLLLFFNSLVYTAFYDITVSTPYIFKDTYKFNDFQVGLCFIPYGMGCLVGPILIGRLTDWNYNRVAHAHGFSVDKKRGDILTREFPLEKARLQVAFPLLVAGNTVLLCYGWVMEVNAHLAAPLILQFLIGLFFVGAFQILSGVLLIDLYPNSPATVTAANNLVRCLVGAGGTAAIIPMLDAMGRGWCFTFIALVVFAATPILWVVLKKGPDWREERRLRLMNA
jgi:MFS family permease